MPVSRPTSGPNAPGRKASPRSAPGRPETRRCQTRPVQPRRLVLVRHAQAGGGPVDADRPLTEQGARHAAAIGTWLARTGPAPDRVLVSPARRARQTWEEAAAALDPGSEPFVDERIYDNTVEAVLA